ncbi:hypothetical protein Anapl_12320 [Anas platyrhynchos]|uniref:Uncharacterized protein n=1 Tax=Anas platyrhynchos TaxID=8839 RepID=R0KYV9_ANAPL|nr:hypothetical protein Anapl_12320 [Anas platyrhynchos]
MKLAVICAMQSAVPCPGLGLFLLSAACVGKRIQIQQRSGSRGHQAGVVTMRSKPPSAQRIELTSNESPIGLVCGICLLIGLAVWRACGCSLPASRAQPITPALITTRVSHLLGDGSLTESFLALEYSFELQIFFATTKMSRRGVGEVEELSGEEHLLRDEQGVSCTARFIAQHIPKFSSDPCFLDTTLQMVGSGCQEMHFYNGLRRKLVVKAVSEGAHAAVKMTKQMAEVLQKTVKRNSSPKPRNAWGAELTAAFALKDKAERTPSRAASLYPQKAEQEDEQQHDPLQELLPESAVVRAPCWRQGVPGERLGSISTGRSGPSPARLCPSPVLKALQPLQASLQSLTTWINLHHPAARAATGLAISGGLLALGTRSCTEPALQGSPAGLRRCLHSLCEPAGEFAELPGAENTVLVRRIPLIAVLSPCCLGDGNLLPPPEKLPCTDRCCSGRSEPAGPRCAVRNAVPLHAEIPHQGDAEVPGRREYINFMLIIGQSRNKHECGYPWNSTLIPNQALYGVPAEAGCEAKSAFVDCCLFLAGNVNLSSKWLLNCSRPPVDKRLGIGTSFQINFVNPTLHGPVHVPNLQTRAPAVWMGLHYAFVIDLAKGKVVSTKTHSTMAGRGLQRMHVAACAVPCGGRRWVSVLFLSSTSACRHVLGHGQTWVWFFGLFSYVTPSFKDKFLVLPVRYRYFQSNGGYALLANGKIPVTAMPLEVLASLLRWIEF